ncbi:MAG: hypothetical protein IAE82_03410 [Opitutaceae bacterium]|nr:hypothetical protein [Opitutaceae bacterium]
MNKPTLSSRLAGTAALAAILAVLSPGLSSSAHAQGCVAVRQMGDVACTIGAFEHAHVERWSVNVNYEWFESHRHFVGREEQVHRAEQGTEVINDTHQINTRISYALSSRTTLSLDVPYFSAVRSSLYEHDRVNRHETSAQGIGDMIVTADWWVKDPMSEPRGNFSIGLGFKMPTGQTNIKDTFHTVNGPVVRNVDQSIQPGDGGWGFTFNVQGFQRLGQTTSLYGSLYYLANPHETNDTYRSADPIVGTNSIPDQYQARAGLSQVLSAKHGLAASLGGIIEGIPSSDLIGGDSGFRRPGYTISVEPGLSWMAERHTVSLSVPIAVDRNRVRSYADKISGRHGDAAFADYAVNVGYGYRW